MKKSAIIAIVMIAVAIAVILSTYSDSSTYVSFAEARSSAVELHVVGKLNKDEPIVYDPQQDANYFSFYMKDNQGSECKVIFKGTKPTDFERAEQIVLTGKMIANEFHAQKILMKCPSKYQADEIEIKASR